MRRPHLHPAPLRVADERRRRVEAHRLRVHQRAQELGRVVAAQPGRLVGEQAERCRVRLREAEAREADELVVDRVRRRLVDAVAEAARDEARPERLDRLLAALAAHRAPQAFRLADREARRRPSRRRAPGPGRRRRRACRAAPRAATRARPAARTTDRRAAAAGARCTDARPCPGSAPAARARPARSGRRGSRAASAGGSASARGSRSGRRRPCPPAWISA